jgi:drug/metabolite transporter (DMT)-like permease
MKKWSHHPDLWMALVTLFWAINSPVLKILYTELSPFVYTAIRFILITTIAVISIIIFPNKEKLKELSLRQWLTVLCSGLFSFVFYQIFLLNGLSMTPVFLASIIVSLSPLFAVILSIILKIEKINLKNISGIIISLCGIVLFQAGSFSDIDISFDSLKGQLYCVGAALSWAIYTMITKKESFTSVPQSQSFLISVLFGTLILSMLFINDLMTFDYSRFNLKMNLLTAYTVIFPIFIAYRLYNKSVKVMGIERTIVYVYLVPVFSGLIAAFIGLDDFTLQKLIASIIVIAGVVLAKLK